MTNATLAVVENKLTPISAAIIAPTVTVTSQYLTGQFEEFTASNAVAGYSMRDILAATVRGSLQAEIKELSLAFTGMIEGTRVKEGEKTIDGPRTAAARKFASWVKSVYGAVRFAGMPILTLDGYVSADAMYADSVKFRKEAGNIDWKGTDEATKEAGKVKKATGKAVIEALEDDGKDPVDVLTLSPEDFAKIKAAAAVKLKETAAKDKLAKMEAKAVKLAKSLVADFGLDDAETVLKRALESLAGIAVGSL